MEDEFNEVLDIPTKYEKSTIQVIHEVTVISILVIRCLVNVFVVYIFAKSRTLRSKRTNLFIMNWFIVDLTIALYHFLQTYLFLNYGMKITENVLFEHFFINTDMTLFSFNLTLMIALSFDRILYNKKVSAGHMLVILYTFIGFLYAITTVVYINSNRSVMLFVFFIVLILLTLIVIIKFIIKCVKYRHVNLSNDYLLRLYFPMNFIVIYAVGLGCILIAVHVDVLKFLLIFAPFVNFLSFGNTILLLCFDQLFKIVVADFVRFLFRRERVEGDAVAIMEEGSMQNETSLNDDC